MTVAIVGPHNAGKSALIGRLVATHGKIRYKKHKKMAEELLEKEAEDAKKNEDSKKPYIAPGNGNNFDFLATNRDKDDPSSHIRHIKTDSRKYSLVDISAEVTEHSFNALTIADAVVFCIGENREGEIDKDVIDYLSYLSQVADVK